MAYATLADVRLDPAAPTIAVADETKVTRLLEDVEVLLNRLVPTLAAAVLAGDIPAALARQVVVGAVLRRLHNPKGYKGEHAGEYGYYFGENGSSSNGWFTDAELNLLRPAGRKRVGTIRVSVPGEVDPNVVTVWPNW